jgi:hypothetical protein
VRYRPSLPRFWFWKILYMAWRLCWWVTESTVAVPVHWYRWWGLGAWLYGQKVRADPLLFEEDYKYKNFLD